MRFGNVVHLLAAPRGGGGGPFAVVTLSVCAYEAAAGALRGSATLYATLASPPPHSPRLALAVGAGARH